MGVLSNGRGSPQVPETNTCRIQAVSDAQTRDNKPWPLSWVLIAILLYMTFQMAYFLFKN